MDDLTIRGIERPHAKLLQYYVLRALFVPFIVIVLPYHYFRYSTMRYRFDAEGVMMSWGVLFRREITLTYSRIQDIHLTSNFIQRWLGLANLEIQTAAGSAGAEMTIEGILEYEAIRDYLYEKMRGSRAGVANKIGSGGVSTSNAAALASVDVDNASVAAALRDVTSELRLAREAIERVSSSHGAS